MLQWWANCVDSIVTDENVIVSNSALARPIVSLDLYRETHTAAPGAEAVGFKLSCKPAEILMSQDYLWEEHVPAPLVEAVRHLRDLFEEAEWQASKVTTVLCYRKLHPGRQVEGIDRYEIAANYLKNFPGKAAALSYTRTLKEGTPSAVFKAHFDLYCAILSVRVHFVFTHIFQIAANARSRRIFC